MWKVEQEYAIKSTLLVNIEYEHLAIHGKTSVHYFLSRSESVCSISSTFCLQPQILPVFQNLKINIAHVEYVLMCINMYVYYAYTMSPPTLGMYFGHLE